MICDVCEKEAGTRVWAVIVSPEPFFGHKECMEIVSDIIKKEGVHYEFPKRRYL